MLRLLLTNDDGIRAPGLRALADALAQHAEVLVVAPDNPSSAKSHSITLHKPLRLDRVDGFGGRCTAYACSGTPSDCVMLGALHLWRGNPPHLVLSGINDGANVAQDLSYSGTVGGALEGAVSRIPSLAISLAGNTQLSFAEAAQVVDALLSALVYGRAFEWTQETLRVLSQCGETNGILAWDLPRLSAGGEQATAYPAPGSWPPTGLASTPCLNVNLPDCTLAAIQGICWTAAGQREYRDVVQETVDPRGKPYYWIAGEKVTDDDTPGTDTHALARGWASVTPITCDITAKSELACFGSWLRERSGS